MRILPAATIIIKVMNKLRILLCWTISDYSGQICMKNRELIVKNRLISYLQKIWFSSIIKKKLEFWHINLWKTKYAERHLTCTDKFFWSFILIIYLNEKKTFAHYSIPSFAHYGHTLRWLWNPVPKLSIICKISVN